MECPKRDKSTKRGAVNHFLSFLKPTLYYILLKISCTDGNACLGKQCKWNNFAFSSDRLFGKNNSRGLTALDRMSEKIS